MKAIMFVRWIIYLCLFQSIILVRAVSIVDTGPGPGPGDTSPGLYYKQWLAARFTITNSTIVTDIEGWIHVSTAGYLTITLYSGGQSIPGDNIASAAFMVSTNAFANWIGQSGLNWNLAPGSYWVAFEAATNSSFTGNMPTPSQSPLPFEGFYYNPYDPNESWQCGPETNITDGGLGIQIGGNVIANPPNPQIQNSYIGMMGTTNGFQFTILWPMFGSVVIETCTNLVNPVWGPLQTNTLSNGESFFNDPGWTNYQNRYYRVRSQ